MIFIFGWPDDGPLGSALYPQPLWVRQPRLFHLNVTPNSPSSSLWPVSGESPDAQHRRQKRKMFLFVYKQVVPSPPRPCLEAHGPQLKTSRRMICSLMVSSAASTAPRSAPSIRQCSHGSMDKRKGREEAGLSTPRRWRRQYPPSHLQLLGTLVGLGEQKQQDI